MKLAILLSAVACALALNSVPIDDGMFEEFTSQGIFGGHGNELRLVSQVTLPNGKVKQKFEQFFNGVRVADTAVTVTVDAGKLTEKTGNIYHVEQQHGLMSAFIITAKDAEDTCLMKYGVTRDQVENVESELIVDPKHGREVFEVNFFLAASEPKRPYFEVDAQSGEIIDQWEGIDTSKYQNAGGPGGNKKTGKYMFGAGTKLGPFTVKKVGNKCTMENDEVMAIDLMGTRGTIKTPFEYDCPDSSNLQTSRAINEAYSPINDGYYFGNVLYKMYKDWVQLTPLDFKLKVRVHYGSNYENAFWNGKELTFGDGMNRFFPLVDINVVTHEAAHGFTGQNSGLVYRSESGGMNEAYSDIAGEAAEQYARGNVDWIVGSDIFKAQGAGLRYFKDPTKDRKSIGHVNQYYEGMNVHYSSGLYNKAFYHLATSKGWDIKMCFQVFTFANKLYWTRDSKFNAGVCGVLQAAKDLGYSEQPIKDAFKIVGLACGSTKPPTKAPVTNAPPPTNAPPTQAPGGCKDVPNMSCDVLKSFCSSPEKFWKDYMNKYCKATCNLCPSSTQPPVPSCNYKDQIPNCSQFKRYCTSQEKFWKDFMKNYCAKTCNC